MKSLFSKYEESIKENILLVTVWGAVIVTGFLALGAIVGNIEGLIVFGRVHSLAVRLGLLCTITHIFWHREQIMLRFGGEIGSSVGSITHQIQHMKERKMIYETHGEQ